MALFFDAAWFDARLGELKLDRGALAEAAGLSREDLALVFTNEREASGAEIRAFTSLLGADLIEVSIRCGVAARNTVPADADAGARLDHLSARLDAIDSWIDEFERETRKASGGG
jgi:hypothetical protein